MIKIAKLPVWPIDIACKTCAHWGADNDNKYMFGNDAKQNRRACEMASSFEDEATVPESLAVAGDYEQYSGAELWTRATFACNQWKKKP